MTHSFPFLHWLDGERVEGEAWKQRRELEERLEKLEAVGDDDSVAENVSEGELIVYYSKCSFL